MAKVTAVNDITAINNYAGQYRPQIITSIVNGLDVVQDLTVIRNLRAPRILPKYVGKKGLRPYDSNVTQPAGQHGTFSKRTIVPRTSMKIIRVLPEELRKTFLSEGLAANAKEYPGGFAQYFWDEQQKTLSAEINDEFYLSVDPEAINDYVPGNSYTVGQRVAFGTDFFECIVAATANQSPSANPEKWTNINGKCLGDGLGTIINAEYANLPAANKIATGLLTETNCYDKVTSFYMAMLPAHQKLGGTIYCSYNVYGKYLLALAEKYKNGTSMFQVPGSVSLYIFSSGNKWVLKPVTWMNGSQRLIGTQKENLYFGTDVTSDMDSIGKMVEDLHGASYIYKMIIAGQIADLSTLYLNDQA